MPSAFLLSCALTFGTSLFLSAISIADDAAKKPSTQAGHPISFTRDVAPLLVKHCVSCHGPKKPEGDFQLHKFARLMKAGESGVPAIVAGKPDESYLVELIVSDDADLRMPKERRPLAAEEIEICGVGLRKERSSTVPTPQLHWSHYLPSNHSRNRPTCTRGRYRSPRWRFHRMDRYSLSGGYHEVLFGISRFDDRW